MQEPAFHILHVEDDYTDALLMRELINDSPHQGVFDITHVDSLRDALNKMKSGDYDAVLLDMNLRDICGVDNILAVKDENPDMPVVVLSGVDSDSAALEALDCGAQEYIIKGHCNGRSVRHAICSSIKRKAVERQFYKEANYDELTNLTNRRFFMDYLSLTLEKARRWKRTETLMFIDLDRFKDINDTYGHDAGNFALKTAARRMKMTLREADMICRYGGDEFTILLDNRANDSQDVAAHIAKKLIEALNKPFEFNNAEISFSASIGIALYPDNGIDNTSLIKSADMAMYKSKNDGGTGYYFARDVFTNSVNNERNRAE
jgi:diguanylate cyclase (GGDEF)-like protein